MNRSRIYPLVVPADYVDPQLRDAEDHVLSLGHGVDVVLAEDRDGATKYLELEELQAAGLDASAAHHLALENLIQLAKQGELTAELYQTPAGRPFMVWHSHWLAASCIRIPYLHALARKRFGGEQMGVSIPHQAAMLVFPLGDRAAREEMRALIRDNESDARNLITFELFSLTADGISAFFEEPFTA